MDDENIWKDDESLIKECRSKQCIQ